MAKQRGYKQGAMSATDAITQLRAAAAKCDNKWMKAHAASARFFGAREADVKHALKRCGTVKSSLMALGAIEAGTRVRVTRGAFKNVVCTVSRVRPRKGRSADAVICDAQHGEPLVLPVDALEEVGEPRKRGVGMFDQVAASMEPGDERDYTITIERGYKGHSGYTGDMRGLQGTEKQHLRAGLDFVSAADNALRRARGAGSDRERHAGALEAFRLATHAHAECSWEPMGSGPDCVQSADALAKRAKKLLGERIDGPAVRGLKGSSPQHFERAKAHFSAADEELEWAASPAARAYGGQKRILAKASRQLTAGTVNCDWVRSKKAKQVCYAEKKRLLHKLAKLEGDDRVFTDGFALDGTRKRRRRKR